MKKRMLAVILSIYLMFAAAAVRCYDLAVGGARRTAGDQSSYTLTVTYPRGTVYDCNMRRLTNTVTKTVAVLEPTAETVAAVTDQLGDGARAVLDRLRSGKPTVADVPMDFKCASSAVFQISDSSVTEQPAAHVIGYINGEGDGVTGVQLAYNSLLKASEPLKVTYTVDANGRPLSGLAPKVTGRAQINDGVVLTIDLRIQRIIETQSSALKKGAVVVMQSSTGKLRAIASFPGFSPANVAQSLGADDAPLINRALTAYNVGSVFKLCVAAAALRSGIGSDTRYDCEGSVQIGSDRFNCNKLSGHGELDMAGALAKSCNCYFIQLGRAVGAQTLYDTCLRFGFNRAYKLADSLNAAKGVLPSRTALSGQPSALANLSFGQGKLLLTPLHIAVMTAAIDNSGFLVTPTLIEGVTDGEKMTACDTPEPHRVLEADLCTKLKEMMSGVITFGTGAAAKPESGVAGGKTATAETGWVKDSKTVTQSWFAGYWQGYTIVVLCEDGVSGATDCAPVFKRICDMIGEM